MKIGYLSKIRSYFLQKTTQLVPNVQPLPENKETVPPSTETSTESSTDASPEPSPKPSPKPSVSSGARQQLIVGRSLNFIFNFNFDSNVQNENLWKLLKPKVK